MSKCTEVTLIETIPAGDILKVVIDETTEALWLYKYADALQFVDKEVIVEYRQDIYKGELRQFIATFILPTVVNTVDKTDAIKLYCEQIDNYSNVSFSEVGIGETKQGCIVFCTHSEFKSSANAVWQEFIIRDRTMHTAKLRLFNYENTKADFSGQYIMTELSRNKYGFKSELVAPVQGECPINPEITIAKEYITTFFMNDRDAQAYIAKYNLLGYLEEALDYEKGYGMMRLAMELSLIDSMGNITKDVDLSSIAEALLASRGYLAHESVLSPTVNNVVLAMSISWKNKPLVLRLLDCEGPDSPPEYHVMRSIQDTVSTILKVRKGLIE